MVSGDIVRDKLDTEVKCGELVLSNWDGLSRDGRDFVGLRESGHLPRNGVAVVVSVNKVKALVLCNNGAIGWVKRDHVKLV